MGTKAQNRERRHESLHDVGVFCTRRRAAVMSPQSVVDFSYISAGSSRLRDNSRKGCTEQMDMQKSKAINWTSDYNAETQEESEGSRRGADFCIRMVCPPCTAGKSTVDGFPKLLFPESALAASTRRFTPGKITKAGRNRLGATGPKNKANPPQRPQ